VASACLGFGIGRWSGDWTRDGLRLSGPSGGGLRIRISAQLEHFAFITPFLVLENMIAGRFSAPVQARTPKLIKYHVVLIYFEHIELENVNVSRLLGTIFSWLTTRCLDLKVLPCGHPSFVPTNKRLPMSSFARSLIL
jgi:hypothetical protein